MIVIAFSCNEDESTFVYLYTNYNKLLYKYAYDILHNHQDVEDAIQISYVKLSKNMAKINISAERKAVNFLITILKNVAIDIYNKNKKQPFNYNESWDESSIKESNNLYQKLEFNDIKSIINELEDEYRIPLLLKYTYGYSVFEIAKILDISETNTGTRIYRAKNKIKKKLREQEAFNVRKSR